MHRHERSAVLSLAAIMCFRMLGLFMILPVFALYSQHLPGATPALIGLALGIYGLMQACLQIPFGSWSDRIGRKRVIFIGLCLFTIGSVIAALATSIYGVILGRALQGAGAIGSTILAMVADLTRDEERSKAMALVGMAIGLSFSLAMILGPLLNATWHLQSIFWLTAILAVISIILLFTIVPKPPSVLANPIIMADSHQLSRVIKSKKLLSLDYGIFALHAMLTATFIAIPIILTHNLNLTAHLQTVMYLVVLVIAFILAVPLIILSEKKRQLKAVFIAAIAILILTQFLMLFSYNHLWSITILLLLFFTAFTLLEASLPSWVSKVSPIRRKGTAMGIYSSSQFLGIFVGGTLGGWLFSHFHASGIFIFCIVIGFIWLIVAIVMAEPPYLSTLTLALPPSTNATQLQEKLTQIKGIHEVALIPREGLVYIKIDKQLIEPNKLRDLVNKGNLSA